MGFLSGKRALIVGVASDRSIAWGIAQAMHREGAELAFSYVNEKFKDRVQPLAESLGSKLTMPLDVTNDAEIDSAFAAIKQAWGSLDIVVHAVAFAPREALTGSFVESTSREAFKVAHDVSSYSLTALARAATAHGGPCGRHPHALLPRRREIHPELQRHGPRQGEPRSQRALPGRDMGPNNIRVNGISAGPIKTLAAAGIAGFRKMLGRVADVAPLRRNVTLEDVGNAAAFLCSDLANGITGEILYVDGGFSTVGMSFPQEAGEGKWGHSPFPGKRGRTWLERRRASGAHAGTSSLFAGPFDS